ncbi:dTMP kinase [archaeon]|jgi:dTMP kinase|nr:dTMP kinase [archaeon]
MENSGYQVIVHKGPVLEKEKFIVFEGIDGSGKGTQIFKAAEYLFNHNKLIDCIVTREPWNSNEAKKIREILKNENDPNSNSEQLLNLYVKDRDKHEDFILESIYNNKIVLSDRYYYSSMAYQLGQGADLTKIIEKNKRFTKPDITFIIDVPAKVAMDRIKKNRNKLDKFEEEKFLNEVRNNYLNIPNYLKKDNIKIINGNQPIDEVFYDIKIKLEEIL